MKKMFFLLLLIAAAHFSSSAQQRGYYRCQYGRQQQAPQVVYLIVDPAPTYGYQQPVYYDPRYVQYNTAPAYDPRYATIQPVYDPRYAPQPVQYTTVPSGYGNAWPQYTTTAPVQQQYVSDGRNALSSYYVNTVNKSTGYEYGFYASPEAAGNTTGYQATQNGWTQQQRYRR